MAKQLARLKDFFEGKRRRCTLEDYHQLKTAGGEDRMKLLVSMPLSNQPVDGIPGQFAEPFGMMAKQDSSANFLKFGVEIKAARFAIFSTDTIKNSALKSDSATLNSFRLIGDGTEEKRKVSLDFAVYIPWNPNVRDWCGDHLRGDFFCETVPAQQEMFEDDKPVKKQKASQPQLVQ